MSVLYCKIIRFVENPKQQMTNDYNNNNRNTGDGVGHIIVRI